METVSRNNIVFDYMHKYNVLAHVEIKDGIGVVKRTGYRPLLEGTFTSEEIFNMLSNRCFPKERSNCKEILRNLGLEEYDIYSIIRKNKGVLCLMILSGLDLKMI